MSKYDSHGYAGNLIECVERHRTDLMRARDITLQFGDVALALERTRELRKAYEDLLSHPQKGDDVNNSSKPRRSDQLPALCRDRVLSDMEQCMIFIRELRRAALQYDELKTIQTCSLEIERLERKLIILKRDTQDEKPKGILALMGVER